MIVAELTHMAERADLSLEERAALALALALLEAEPRVSRDVYRRMPHKVELLDGVLVLSDFRWRTEKKRVDNGRRKDCLDSIEELLRMTAAQTAENAKLIAANSRQISDFSREFRADLAKSRKEHDREMKEIRGLFKQMIRRIAV